MASSIDTGQVILEGNLGGWSRYKIAIPAPPSGTDQALYIIRYWLDEIASNVNVASNTLLWQSGQHLGFGFTGTHPTKPSTVGAAAGADNLTAYTDHFGLSTWGQQATSQTSAGWSSEDNSSDPTEQLKRDYAFPSKADGAGALYWSVGTGNGDDTRIHYGDEGEQDHDEMPWTVPRNPATGALSTSCFKVYSDPVNDAVYVDAWKNSDSINLATLDLQNDIDGNDPKAAIPVSNSWSDTHTLNADPTTGTNWRPSTGVMGFPTYFLVQNPMTSVNVVIDYIGVRYDSMALLP